MTFTQTYTGRASYLADFAEGPSHLFIAVECQVDGYGFHALLDCGSQWCMLPVALATTMGLDPEAIGPTQRLSTRLGTLAGGLVRLPLVLVADEGESLDVDATWFVSSGWTGPTVIGWKGCLERIQFALDPFEDCFYFAAP